MLDGEHAPEDFPRGAVIRRHPLSNCPHLRLRVTRDVHAIRHHRPGREHRAGTFAVEQPQTKSRNIGSADPWAGFHECRFV